MKLKKVVYEDFYADKNLFDFSNYSQYSKFDDPVNMNVIVKVKDELEWLKIGTKNFAGSKSKIYSLIDVYNKENNKVKGVNIKKDIKNILKFCLIKKIIKDNMKRIQSKLHKIGTYEICKSS